ncbi:unnamed protein product [Phyllotreta striolata]|uniref:Translocon-associated protein subunit delta n=1 Tax=Phyllotreta striolata TaxID=444603 RepID=A0A9N9TJS8_PHYSR|nr:unnamed protein product [Phyllotreta striolata]
MTRLYILAFISLLSCTFCLGCSNPKVTSSSFTTVDATIVTNIAYISEFSVTCESGKAGNLYAEVEGNISPVSIVGNNRYQVSWTEEAKTAKSGDRVIRLFDEDGYTTYKKASRSKEDTQNVPALVNVVLSHPGAYNGPWLKSEFIATILSLLVAYIAVSSRAKVLS